MAAAPDLPAMAEQRLAVWLARRWGQAFCYSRSGLARAVPGEVTGTFSLPESTTGRGGKASDWSFRRVKKKAQGNHKSVKQTNTLPLCHSLPDYRFQ